MKTYHIKFFDMDMCNLFIWPKGIEDVPVHVSVHVEEDEALAVKTENGISASGRNANWDLEEEGMFWNGNMIGTEIPKFFSIPWSKYVHEKNRSYYCACE